MTLKKNTGIAFLAVSALFLCIKQGPACTIFAGSDGKNVLVGNNEDDPSKPGFLNAKIAFNPAQGERKYGNMVYSFDDGYPEGGVNTAGLFFDITQLPEVPAATYPPGTPDFAGPPGSMLVHILDTCATVDEAVKIMRAYRLPGIEAAQVFFADKTGAASVIGVAKNGTIIETTSTAKFLLATNFNLANHESGNYPEPRYTKLTQHWEKDPSVSRANFLAMLQEVHFEGNPVTVYSNLYDLKKGDMYLYYLGNYKKPLKMHLEKELKNGARTVHMSDLFPKAVRPQKVSR